MKIGMAWLPIGWYVENYKINFCFSNSLNSKVIYFLNCISLLISLIWSKAHCQHSVAKWFFDLSEEFKMTEKKHIPSAFLVFHNGWLLPLLGTPITSKCRAERVFLCIIWQTAMPLRIGLFRSWEGYFKLL